MRIAIFLANNTTFWQDLEKEASKVIYPKYIPDILKVTDPKKISGRPDKLE